MKFYTMKNTYSFLAIFVLLYLSGNTLLAQTDTIRTKSGLKMLITQKGNGEFPKKKQRLAVHYTGMLKDGKIFDSSIDKKPISFRVGWGEMIPAWDEAFMLLDKGSKAILWVPAKIGYGAKGVEHPQEDYYLVPPNSDLIFEVELVEMY